MFKTSCTIIFLLLSICLFGQAGSKELNIIANQKGKKTNNPPSNIYWFMEGRETECNRLFWFKDELPTSIKNKRHYRHKRVDLVMKYDDFFMIAVIDNHKGRNSELILLNTNYEVIEEYVFMGKEKNTYRIIKERIESGKIKTKAKFLKDIEEFEKTIPKKE